MCAITGIWDFHKNLSRGTITRFTNSLSHRGPDGFGYCIDRKENFGLGHRRLSILDVKKRAEQPMKYGRERYAVVFNGEIYNFLELRRELESYGYSFRTTSDTEVLLISYIHWGKECLNKFNGMWAFAIWDNQKKKLFLCRDRFGIKPLYYLYIPHHLFSFASETYAFKFLDGFTREIDIKRLRRVLTDSHALEGYGYTIFKDIFQLLPGHYMEVEKGKPLQQKRWWSTLHEIQHIDDPYERQIEEFNKLFESSCTLRLRSDVPIGTALSGGIDSSSVYSTIYRIMKEKNSLDRVPKQWKKAFVEIFPNTFLNEMRYAQKEIAFVRGMGEYVSSDTQHLVDKIISSTLLFDSIYSIPIYTASNIYKHMNDQGIKISLDGHGVDEMMYGYPHLVISLYKIAYQERNKTLSSELYSLYKSMVSKRALSYEEVLCQFEILKKKTFMQSIMGIYFYKNFMMFFKKFIPPNHSLSDKQENIYTMNEMDRVLYEAFHYSVLPTILRNFDRASMQHGVEVRMPFMDWRLVSYVFSLPIQSKIGKGCTKRILRDAMKGVVPETIRKRKIKIGLNAPLKEWFEGPMKEYILDVVHSQKFINSNIWDGTILKNNAVEKMNNKSWTFNECLEFWPYINAYIILHDS